MTRTSSRVACAVAVLAVGTAFAARGADVEGTTADPACLELRPLPQREPANVAEVALGKRLFFDELLSRPGGKSRPSCYSCHKFQFGGATQNRKDLKINGEETDNNSPSIITSTLNFRQRWRGNKETLHDVITVPIVNLMNDPVNKDVDASWVGVIRRLQESSEYDYGKAFTAVYKSSPITREQIENALVAYMDALAYPAKPEFSSRFDQHCRGHGGLTDDEKKGFRLFRDFGCVACHQGENVGGNMMAPRDAFTANLTERYQPCATGSKCDTWWKVPSLRNVGETRPYFHDGSEDSLEAAVKTMAKEQLGRESITDEEAALIAAFLRTLTSSPDDELTRNPFGSPNTVPVGPDDKKDGGGW